MERTQIVRPADRRLENWNRKYDGERVKQLIDAGKDAMRAHAEQVYNDLHDTEVAVKQVLNAHPVPVSLVSSYLCFGREMWKAANRYAGALLVKEAGVKVAKWEARNLDRAVLVEIAKEVFDARVV